MNLKTLLYRSKMAAVIVAAILIIPTNSLAAIPNTVEWQDVAEVYRTNAPYGSARAYAMTSDTAGNIYTFYGPESSFQVSDIETRITKHMPSGVEEPGPSGTAPWFSAAEPDIYEASGIPALRKSILVADEMHNALYLMVVFGTRHPDDAVLKLYKHDINTGARLWTASVASIPEYVGGARMTVDGNGYPWVVWNQDFGSDSVRAYGFRLAKFDIANGAILQTGTEFQTGNDKILQAVGATKDRLIITYQEKGQVAGSASHDLVATVYNISGSRPILLSKGEYSWEIEEPSDEEPHLFYRTSQSLSARYSPVFSDGVITRNGNFAVGGYYGFYRPSNECEFTESEGGIDACSLPRFYPVVITLNIEDATIASTYVERGTSRRAWISGDIERAPDYQGVASGANTSIKPGRGENVLIMLSYRYNHGLWEVDALGKRVDVRRQQSFGYFYNGADLESIDFPPGGSSCRLATYLENPVFAYGLSSVAKQRAVVAGIRRLAYAPVNGYWDNDLWADCQTDLSGFWDSYNSNRYKASLSSFDISYCSSHGLSTFYEWIESIMVGSNQSVSGNNNGYADFTAVSGIALQRGQNSLTLTPRFRSGFGPYHEFWDVRVDLNHDFQFSSDELLFSGLSDSIISDSITIPSSALSGDTMMRVSMQFGGVPPACGDFEEGEVEDHAVSILP